MPLVLDATVGTATANAYCTVAEANDYHDSRLHVAAWTSADLATRTAAIVWATRLLDSTIQWASWPTDPDFQRLQWPRTGLLKRGGFEELPFDVIPEDLKFATAEFARLLIEADRTADSDIQKQGITSFSVPGPVSFNFKDNVPHDVLPDSVVNLIPPEWIARRLDRRSFWRPVVRT